MRFTRALALAGIHVRSASAADAATLIPRRSETTQSITPRSAVGLVAVYRAISILATAVSQLSLDVERAGIRLPDVQVPSLIRRPDIHRSRADFVEQLMLSLAVSGNAYILRRVVDGETVNLDPLNPWECWPALDPKTEEKTIGYRGRQYTTDQIEHIALMPLPGSVLGLGPIQAAQVELAGARDVRDYSQKWFTETGQPAAVLSTDQATTDADLKLMRNAWNYLDAAGEPIDAGSNPSRVRVLGKGMKYQPIFISPRDAQWIESQKFNTTQIARLFGVPSSLMLAAVEGSSQTYQNVEQEWIGFTRFTLMAYIRKIEEALTAVTPRGQTVRFNVETLQRSDTKTRYEAHQLAIEMGLYSDAYARGIEGIPATAAPATTPTKDTADAAS
jgi:HK97 family phage portal protein